LNDADFDILNKNQKLESVCQSKIPGTIKKLQYTSPKE
jgi:hypothetical protein